MFTELITNTYFLIAVKFTLGMLVMILQINILGKYEFSVNTPLNQIQNYVLGGIIGGVIYNTSVPMITFIIILLIWSLIVVVVKLLTVNNFFKTVIIGNPVILIRNGEVNVENCVRVGISADQLMLHLRSEGIISTKDVKIAIMESSGKLTILDKNAKNPKFPLINNGSINHEVLEIIGTDEQWLLDNLHEQGIESPSQVYIAEYVDGRLTFITYPETDKRLLAFRRKK
ncbi:DUF421 domain-containing protein [Alloscardovia criceti]|uniref:DUF421 domain-containing protein n=1 Tax=Alloscardovia criceti TaxID=356828 RepID=UPI000367AF0E|nr:YetF domain-containing protein [Alloscardovia criceti]